MTNKFFEDEEITDNDLYFLCYMIERIARKIHQRNRYVVNHIARDEWVRLISLANVLHCENPMRLILATLQPGENYVDGMIRVYNDDICKTIDNYNSSAYYEPSYVITRAYNSGDFE